MDSAEEIPEAWEMCVFLSTEKTFRWFRVSGVLSERAKELGLTVNGKTHRMKC